MNISKEKEREIIDIVTSRYQLSSYYRSSIEKIWYECYKLYRGIVKQKVVKHKSNVFVNMCFLAVNTILPRIISSVLSVKPFIDVLPATKNDIKNSEIAKQLLIYNFEKNNFYRKLKLWVKEALIYGTAIRKVVPKYIVKKIEDKDYRVFLYPEICEIAIEDFFIDPDAIDINEDCEWVIDRKITTKNFLYNCGLYEKEKIDMIEDKEEFIDSDITSSARRDFLSTYQGTKDKYKKRLEVLEYYGFYDIYDNGQKEPIIATVVNKKYLIKIEKNPYKFFPYVALKIGEMPNEFYGIGIIEPIITMQYALNDTFNQILDNVNLIINRQYIVERSANVDIDSLILSRPGGIHLTDNINGIRDISLPDISVGALNREARILEYIQQITGATSHLIAQPTTKRQTASEISILTSEANSRIKMIIDDVEDCIKKLSKIMIKMNQMFLSEEIGIRITDDEKGTYEFLNISHDDIEGEFDLRPVGSVNDPAGNKMVKQIQLTKLAQIIPKLYPTFDNYEFCKLLLEMHDVKNAEMILGNKWKELSDFIETSLIQGITPEQILFTLLQRGKVKEGEEVTLPVKTPLSGDITDMEGIIRGVSRIGK